ARDEVKDMVRRYVASNRAVRLPRPSPELFVPIQTFDPAVESRRRAVEWLLRDVERRLCRAARSARRAVR
ncbi:MAG: hypothetical protein D6738_00880, partial [Acidobacteria bacterium]